MKKNGKIVWSTQKKKISTLLPSKYNPRKATDKQTKDLETSLDRFNLAAPVIVNKNNHVIGGHFRLKILKKKGIKEVDVRVPNRQLGPKEEKELNLRLNRNLGEWNFDALSNFNENLLKDVGFTPEELDETFGLDMDDDFDADKELAKILRNRKRRTRSGDIWQLGEHRLIIGNCIIKKNWQKLLGKERFDFMFTDPPYRLAYTERARKVKTKEGMKLKRDKIYVKTGQTDKKGKPRDFGYKFRRRYQGLEQAGGVPEYDEWLSKAAEYQNPKGANIMIFENWRNTPSLWTAIEKYWKIKNMVIWHLPNRNQGFSAKHKFFNKYDIAPLAGEGVVNSKHEDELNNYLQAKGQKILDTYEVILNAKQGDSYWDKKKGTKWAKVTDHISWVASTSKSNGQNIVFGTKPIQILVPYIKILAPRNGIVAEPFAGSGSTIIGCEIMKRKCRAIELSDIYAEVVLARWEKFTGQEAIKQK